MRKRICVLLALACLAGCRSHDQSKRYPIQGSVLALDAPDKMATIDAGKIDDWMEAMVMDYPVKPDSEFAKLHVGDHLEGTLVVNGEKYYVTSVRVTPKKP